MRRATTLMIVFALAVLASPVLYAASTFARDATVTQVAGGKALDKLFAQLKGAGSATEAEAITNQIWRFWFQTENAVVQHHMNKAQMMRRAGAFKAAMIELDKIVELAPDYAEGWNQRATVLYMLKRDIESVADIQQVLRLEPRHFGALSGLGLIHMRAENWKSAIASFERALKVHPFLRERAIIPKLRDKLKGQPL